MTGAQPRRIDYLPLGALLPAEANPKAHDLDALRASLGRFGMIEVAAVLDERTGRMISGHGRLETLLSAEAAGLDRPEGVEQAEGGGWLVPVLRGWASADDAEAEAALVTVNETTIAPGWREQELAPMLERIAESRGGLEGTGFDRPRLDQLLARLRGDDGDGREEPPPPGPSLADRFLVPPFSVLDARQGYWQERKRAWLDLGLQSEIGRGENLLGMSESARAAQGGEGTSVFDPVVCELAYRWWAGPGARVLDPFAGGSVRGIVAAMLGLNYHGIELRPEQVAANFEQAAQILGPRDVPGEAGWVVGDALAELAEPLMPDGPGFDLLFGCPPYFDLERYSEEEGDLSNAGSYAAFLEAYREIIRRAALQLADDRFAVWVVGEIRDKAGLCRGFVPDTIAAFEAAGLSLYNEAVLVTSVGSLAMRAARIFAPGRKLGRAHQAVLVFVKGDPAKAAAACGPVEVGDPAELFGKVIRADGPADSPAAASEPQSPGSEPAWAKGRPVEKLKAVAEIFAAYDEGLTLGAFARVRENAIAAWADDGQLLLLEDAEGRPVAAAQIIEVKSRRKVEDFSGRQLGTMGPGSRRVGRFACRPGYEAALLGQLDLLGQTAPLWIDAWQEHPTDRAILQILDARWLGTKIRASSELIGVWLLSTAAEAIAEPAPLSWLEAVGLARTAITFDPAELLAEIDALGPSWADHYSSYNQGKSWSALALRGYGGRPGFIEKPAEMSKGWKREHPDELGWEIADTPLREDLPAAEALIGLVPGELHRVRLMRLLPGGGELTRHADITDPDAGLAPGKLARIHLPLRTNERVVFQSWGLDGSRSTLSMPEGQACYLDTRKPHTAINGGDTERIHLVIDAVVTPELLGLISEPAEISSPAPIPAEFGEQQLAHMASIEPVA